MTQQLAGTAGRENASGGSAAAGGMNLHARVAAVAAVNLLGRRQLGWLKELEIAPPVEIWCETNGPGDDLRFVLENTVVVEAQVKKGLRRGADLWTALESLAHGIGQQLITYGLLIVDIDASTTIRRDLAQGIVRLGDGRADSLNEITGEFKVRLEHAGLSVKAICGRLRIVVVHCADHDDASELAAKTDLMRLCATNHDADNAWTAVQLSAHSLIERRGRWSTEALFGILKTAKVELRTVPGEYPSAAISGLVWEHLDEVSPHRGYIQTFRQHYLISDKMTRQPFGGRDEECQRLDAWLSDASAPSRFLICAPTARGKSALLVQWTEHLESDATWAIVFVPISLRFSTDRPTVFYALLATQLARLLQVKLAPPSADLDTYYQGISAALLSQAMKASQHVLIVVDGLDEAQSIGFNATVFPPSLPPNIKILVSAREQAGDCGPEGWLKRLDWQGNGRAVSTSLSTLDRISIASILKSAGFTKEGTSNKLVDRLMELSAGEPLLLSLYVEDLSDIAARGEYVGSETLDGLLPGFTPYFSRAFDAHSFAEEHVGSEVVDTTLAVLAMAIGPLEGHQLTDLVCRHGSIRRPAASDRFVKPLKRFIAGDGRADHGYVLNHPKLGEYLREERFDSITQQTVEQVYLDWGRGVANGLIADPNAPAPFYILRYHVDHLRRAGIASLDDIDILLSDGWRQAWFRMEKDYVGYADSLLAASVAMRRCATYHREASRALRLKIKIALLVSSVRSQGISVPSELLAMALQEQLITLRQALNIVELQVPENRPGYLLALASSLPSTDLEQLLSDILQTENIASVNQQLAILAPHLRTPRREEIIDRVLSWLRTAAAAPQRIGIIATLTNALGDEQLKTVLAEAASKILTGQDALASAISLAPAIDTLYAENRRELAKYCIDQCLLWIESGQDPLLKVEALELIAHRISLDQLGAYITRLMPLINPIQVPQPPVPQWDFKAQFQEKRRIKAFVMLTILEIHQQPIEVYNTKLMTVLAPLLVPDYWSVDTLVKIVAIVRADARQAVVAIVHHLALSLPTANNRTHALLALARSAASPLRKTIIEQAFFNARRVEDDYSRGLALVSLFSTLPAQNKEQELSELWSDIQKVIYALHIGELLLQLSNQHPMLAGLAEAGFRTILKVNDIGNSVSTMLRELSKFPEHMRLEVFQQCWQRILMRSDHLSSFQLGMAARYATEFWTIAELDIARSKLTGLEAYSRHQLLIDLLPVAVRLGIRDLFDEAFNAIAKQGDSNIGVSNMVQALKFLPLGDSRRSMLRQFWFLAVKLENPNIGSLIDGFELLDSSDQTIAWPLLTARTRTALGGGQSLARLSRTTKNPIERAELLDAALASCANEKADTRIQQAAQIISACTTEEERWRAFDLMTDTPAASRTTVLSALQFAAPIISEVGHASLAQAVMGDIRQSSTWWP